MLTYNQLQDLFMHLKDTKGFIEGYEGQVWEVDGECIEWNRENWEQLKREVNHLKFKGLPMRYFDYGNFFRIESSYCREVRKDMFVNVSLSEEDLEYVVRRINDIHRGQVGYSKGVEVFDEGYFSTVYVIDNEWIWKEYKNYEYHLYGDSLNKDGEILLDLKGLRWFPELYAYIPEKGYVAEYVKGEKFDFSYFHEDELDIVMGRLLDLVEDVESRGYLVRDIKEENLLDRVYMDFVLVDVGYFIKNEDVKEEDRLDYIRELFTFSYKDKKVLDSLRNAWVRRGKSINEIENIIEELKYR